MINPDCQTCGGSGFYKVDQRDGYWEEYNCDCTEDVCNCESCRSLRETKQEPVLRFSESPPYVAVEYAGGVYLRPCKDAEIVAAYQSEPELQAMVTKQAKAALDEPTNQGQR